MRILMILAGARSIGQFGDMIHRQSVARMTSRMILGKPIGKVMLIDTQTLATLFMILQG